MEARPKPTDTSEIFPRLKLDIIPREEALNFNPNEYVSRGRLTLLATNRKTKTAFSSDLEKN